MTELVQPANSGKALHDDEKSSTKASDNTLKVAHAQSPACESVVHEIYRSPSDKTSRIKDSTSPSKELAKPVEIYLPDYHDGLPVKVQIGQKDNAEIERRYKELLADKDKSKLNDFDRQKLRALATADTYMDKYQQALSEREESYAKLMPQPMKGAYLASMALQDGAVIGANKQVLHQLIDEGALGDLSSGVAVGIAIGKVAGKLLMSANLPLRVLGAVINIGGIAAGITELGKLGQSGIKGMQESWDGEKKSQNGLKNLLDGSSENIASVKSNVEEKIGPVLADAALFALGLAAAKGVEGKITGGKSPGGKTEATKTEVQKTEAPKAESPKTEAPKTEAPKTEAPKTETQKTETAKPEVSKTDPEKTVPEIKLSGAQANDARNKIEHSGHPHKKGWMPYPDGWYKAPCPGFKWRDTPFNPHKGTPPLREVRHQLPDGSEDIWFINRVTNKPYDASAGSWSESIVKLPDGTTKISYTNNKTGKSFDYGKGR